MSRVLDHPTQTMVVPPLQSGDRLTRTEFERRYEAMPKHIKAELIEGIVYMASPVRIENHAEPHASNYGLAQCVLGFYPGHTILR